MKKSAFLLGMLSLVLCFCSQAAAQDPDGFCANCVAIVESQGTENSVVGSLHPQKTADLQEPEESVEPCNACCPQVGTFANIFTTSSQIIPPGGPVTFEGVNAAAGIDTTMAPVNGAIMFTKTGWYSIEYDLNALLTSPFPFPVPSWTSSLFLNGVLVPGSSQSAFALSSDDIASHTSGKVIIQITSGDTLKLLNTAVFSITLVGVPFGSLIPCDCGTISIIKISD